MTDRHLFIASLAVLPLLLALPVGATTYVPMTDEDLVALAPVIVEGRVAAVEPSPGWGRPATDAVIEVDRTLKGLVPGSTIVVRTPGGLAPGGERLRVFGVPRFVPGETVLLFLVPRDDGTYGVYQLLLGIFHVSERGGQRIAVRDFSEARLLPPPGGKDRDPGSSGQRIRDADRFTRWIAAGAESGSADYLVEGSVDTASIGERYSFLEYAGQRFRWFDFDSGKGVGWRAYRKGLAEMPDGGYGAFQEALTSWTDDPATPIRLDYGGTTSAGAGLTGPDGVNAILFDDPNGEIPGSFSCSTGGVLAMGGISATTGAGDFEGRSYWVIGEGDIVTQDGAGCFFALEDGANGDEVFGHEVGHALGLGHSCGDDGNPECTPGSDLDDALMRAYAHGDGRGARLGTDDRAAIAELYGTAKGRRADLVGLGLHTRGGYYSSDLVGWTGVGGSFLQLVSADLDDDGIHELAGIGLSGMVYASYDLATWQPLGKELAVLTVGDLDGDGRDELAGLDGAGGVWYTYDLSSWQQMPGALETLVTGDFDGDGRDDLAGTSRTDGVYYSTSLSSWTQVPGSLVQVTAGDLDGDGRDELAGVSPTSQVYFTSDLSSWTKVPGFLRQVEAGDFDGDGGDDLAGVSPTDRVYYSLDLASWVNVPGILLDVVTGDFDGDGRDEIAGVSPTDRVYYTPDLASWVNIPGHLTGLSCGELDGE